MVWDDGLFVVSNLTMPSTKLVFFVQAIDPSSWFDLKEIAGPDQRFNQDLISVE